MNIYILW